MGRGADRAWPGGDAARSWQRGAVPVGVWFLAVAMAMVLPNFASQSEVGELTGLVDGRSGLRRLVSRLRRWRVGARWYEVALLTGPLVMGATVFALSLASPEFRPDFLTADNRLSIVVTAIVVGLIVGFFEELGWTGFALPRLRRRYGVVTTGLVMGLLWSAWHFPMFAGTTDPTGNLPAALVVAVLLFAWLPPYRVLMYGSTTGPRACSSRC